MAKVTSESAFEDSIEEHLLASGWFNSDLSGYDRALGLDPSELITFLETSQPDEWAQLTQRLGGAANARERVAKYIGDQLTQRGTVDVLRGLTKMNGVSFRLAFFAPANGLTKALWERYDANRLSVVRQLHHSESNTGDSVDLTLFVNGIPTATAELKNPLTQQSVGDAMRQHQRDRNPSDLIFRARTVVHFAVDPNQVYMTTRLAGEQTRFLPFNQGSGGGGQKGGAGNPAKPDGYDTAYLWEQVWQRDAWLGLLGEFVHIEDGYDAEGNKTGETTTGTSTAGRGDFLIAPDGPSFTDLDAAYRAFFMGSYDVPANESVPNELLRIRVLDERSWLGPMHIRATELTVEIRGSEPAGTMLEYFSPTRRERFPIERSGQFTVGVPDGVPASNTWLWLTDGNSWRDYRALSGPWTSAEQLEAAGVESEQTSRDEQAAVEAIIFGGEGPFVEFKSQLPQSGPKTDRMFRTIAAFANGAGGTVVLGVDRDELTVVGLGPEVEVAKERDRVGQLIRTRVLPTPEFVVNPYQVDGKDVLFVEISPGPARRYGVILDMSHRDTPQFFVRRGASTYPAQPSDLNQVVQEAVARALGSGPAGWPAM